MKQPNFQFLSFSALTLLLFNACSTQQDQKVEVSAPIAALNTYSYSIHDQVIEDPYAWLKNKQDQAVIDYLEAENAYAEQMMSGTEELQVTLYNEMRSRIKEDDQSAPIKRGNYFYYSRTEANKQYTIYCRKKESMDTPEEIILDLNPMAEGKKYLRLGNYSISQDQQYMAYSLDSTGAEVYDLYIKNLNTGEVSDEVIPNVSYSIVWANDNQTLFYSINDEANRPYKIFRHKLDVPYKEDMQVFHEEDERYFVGIGKSKNNEYLIISNSSKETSENYLLPANTPNGEFKLFSPKVNGVEYEVIPHTNKFYILTNDKAVNYRLMECKPNNTLASAWTEVIAHNPEVKLESVEEFANQLVISERSQGLRKLRVINESNKKESYYINFPDPVYNVSFSGNIDFNSKAVRFNYSSLVWPNVTFDFDLSKKERIEVKRDEVPNYTPENYISERIYAPANDGTLIPISLVYKKGIEKNGANPLYLYAYGSYGSITPTAFSAARVSLLDRGVVYAIAHIRGSGDMGEEWYLNGKYLKKKNTFSDFVNCADFLISESFTNANQLAAMGGSAGGLLMGAVANLKPEVFKVIVAKVPFVDVINTMLDASLPLTVTEYEEWGNPNEKEYFDYMLSYSPYDNVEAKDYPNMLVTVGLNDPRVGYWEGAKWVAKLRANKTDNNTILLKTNMGAGHSGSSGRYDYLKEVAFEYAYVLGKIL